MTLPPVVSRATGVECIRDGGSLAAYFDAEDGGSYILFLPINQVKRGPELQEWLGFFEPVLIDQDPDTRPPAQPGRTWSILSGAAEPLSWSQAAKIVETFSASAHGLDARELERLDELRFAVESRGGVPPGRERFRRLFKGPW